MIRSKIISIMLTAVFVAAGAVYGFGQCTFTGSIASTDITHANALKTSGVDSTAALPQACPGIFTTTGPIHYDQLTFTNPSAVSQEFTIAPNATGCSRFLMSSTHLNTFMAAAPCTNYLGSMGSGFSDLAGYSVTVPGSAQFAVVIEEFDPAIYCASYSVTITPCPNVVPTSGVIVSGRVLTADGRGLRNARVFITDSSNVTRYAFTQSMGYFQFDNVATGQTYTVGVNSRRFTFASRQLTVSSALSNVDFVASGGARSSEESEITTKGATTKSETLR